MPASESNFILEIELVLERSMLDIAQRAFRGCDKQCLISFTGTGGRPESSG